MKIISNKKLILLCLILLALPMLYAISYGDGLYGAGVYGAIDADQDLIADNVDNLFYNSTYVTTSGITKLNVTIDGIAANGTFNKTQEVLFYDQTDLMINFSHNFTEYKLNLSVVEIQKAATYLIVNFSNQVKENKTLYLEDDSFIALCVKDQEISSINEISSGCDGSNETDFTTCLGNNTGVTLNGINCTDEGTTIKVGNLKYSAIRGTVSTPVIPVTTPSGGDGGGTTTECYEDADCRANHYCFENKCYDYECFTDDVCEETETCWNGRCVKLFDIEILDFESPISLGEFFSFGYLIKGMADFNHDVEINFQIEKNNEVISSGKDTIYLGSFDEKTKTSKLFLPTDITSGKYIFSITVNYEHYKVESHRTIEISVEEDKARIGIVPEIRTPHIIVIIILASFSILLLCFIIYLQRKKLKSMFAEEQRWLKRHRVSILTFVLFVILGILAYYCGLFRILGNWISSIPWGAVLPYVYYIVGGILALAVLVIFILLAKKIKKKIKMPKIKIKTSKRQISFAERKIKSLFKKLGRGIIKHKIPVIISFLVVISGLLIYYFKVYEIVVGRALSLANWISLIPWNIILPYIYYSIGGILSLAVVIILIILAKKIKKKVKIPKIKKVRVQQQKLEKMKVPKEIINLPEIKISKGKINKIKSMFKKLGKYIVKHKKPIIISSLVILSGLFVYYFKVYEIVVGWALSFANWVLSIPWSGILPYIYYVVGSLLILGALVVFAILARKLPKSKINKIKSIFKKLWKYIVKHKIPVIIFFLVIISGLLIYYFKVYEIVVGWALSFANWVLSIPWSGILPYIYYVVGSLLILGALVVFAILARKLPKSKINKIKSIFKKLWKYIVKHKIPVIIFFLVIISGLLIYYFKVYEIVVGWALSLANWVSLIPWNIVLIYVCYIAGGIVSLGTLIFLIILARKLPKSKMNKIKSMFKKLWKLIVKYKVPVIVSFLVILSGLFVYYFKVYEIVVGWALSFANWVLSIPWNIILPYIYYILGGILSLAVVIILVILARKLPKSKINKIKSIFKKLWKYIVKHKIPVIISCLVILSALLIYYFNVYEIVVGRALSLANWVSSLWSILLPYLSDNIGTILALAVLIIVLIIFTKKMKKKITKKKKKR